MNLPELLEIKLHRNITLNDDLAIRRVPGGWIYTEKHHVSGDGFNTVKRYSYTSTFVPFPVERKP